MNWYSNLKIGRKLALGFGLCVSLTVLIGLSGLNALTHLQKVQDALAKEALPAANSMAETTGKLRDARIWLMRVADKQRADELESSLKAYQSDLQAVDQEIQEHAKILKSEEGKKLLKAAEDAWTTQKSIDETVVSLSRSGKYTEAVDKVDGESKKQFRDVLCKATDALQEFDMATAQKLSKAGDDAFRSSSVILTTTGSFAILLAVIFGWFITRTIVSPIRKVADRMDFLTTNCIAELGSAVDSLAAGDLTPRVTPKTQALDIDTKDETGMMARTFNALLDRTQGMVAAYNSAADTLSALVRQLQTNSLDVAATSQQLASAASETNSAAVSISETMDEVGRAVSESARGSQEIAKGTEQMSLSATQAAAAMEQLESAIQAVRSGSGEQREAVAEALQNVSQGIAAVDKTVESMKQIEHQVGMSSAAVYELGEKGQKIGDIVQTIEDIAQQTNLLNAAIEAARAGDQGKGFAVVADEVRKLAERSASATKEIADLIGGVRTSVEEAVRAMTASASEVAEGAARSSEAGEALRKIDSSATTVGKVAQENETSIDGMVDAAKKVEGAISAAAAVSQESAASAEELSATAEEVSTSTEDVADSIKEQTASIQQVSAAAQQLSSMSTQLEDIIRTFKVDGNQTASKEVRPSSAAKRAA